MTLQECTRRSSRVPKSSQGIQSVPGYCIYIHVLGLLKMDRKSFILFYMINYHKIYTFKHAYNFLMVADAYFTIHMEPTWCIVRVGVTQ